MVAGALAASPLLGAGPLAPLAGAIGIAAIGAVALALAGFVGILPWALGLLLSSYAIVDVAQSEPLAAAPLYGAGVLLLGELVYASRELSRAGDERAVLRFRWLAIVVGAAFVAGLVTTAANGLSGPVGLAAEIVAGLAAVGLLAVPAGLVRRRVGRGTTRARASRLRRLP